MVQYSGAPSLTATAAGNVYLDLSALNLANTSQSAMLNSGSLAGQTVDLLFQDSGSMSAYDFAVAATELDADAGVNTPVDLTFTAMGNLPVGSIISRKGDVSLTAGGAIKAIRDNGATVIAANNINLAAGTTINGGSVSIPLLIDAAYSGAGDVTARADGSIWLDQVAGNLSLNQVQSAAGNIELQAPGALVDGRSGTSAPANNVQAGDDRARRSVGWHGHRRRQRPVGDEHFFPPGHGRQRQPVHRQYFQQLAHDRRQRTVGSASPVLRST